MSPNLRILVVIFVVLIMIITLLILRKGKLSVKYSILWLFVCVILLVLMLFPKILDFISSLAGFEVASNMIFSIFIAILLFISLSLTIIVSGQKKKINKLIQEVSILKAKVNKKNS